MRRALACLALIAFVPLLAATQTLQQRIEAQRAKAQLVQWKLHLKRAELHRAALREGDLQGQLNQTNAAIGQVNGRISVLQTQVRSTQSKLDWNTIQLRAAQSSLALHDRLFKQRLVGMYEQGDLGYLSVLLAARTFAEFVERWEDLRLVIASNQKAVRERQAAAERVAAIQAAYEQDQLVLQGQQQEQTRARTQLGSLASERQNLVAVADDQRRNVATQVTQIEEISAAEEARLEDLIAERERELEAQRAAARRAAGINGTIAPPPVSGPPAAMSWPVSGPITSPFGWRRSPFGGGSDFHPGIDIGVPTGTTVKAAAAGTVIMAQWYDGYGNYVLIDHGGGISTGYAHNESFYVSVGQKVERGQAIAASDSTGMSTGPHVHFEVRRKGKPTDPLPWLR
jgi:murein DD-endopeptidase MepM/ murein hydrolase activator NlpD